MSPRTPPSSDLENQDLGFPLDQPKREDEVRIDGAFKNVTKRIHRHHLPAMTEVRDQFSPAVAPPRLVVGWISTELRRSASCEPLTAIWPESTTAMDLGGSQHPWLATTASPPRGGLGGCRRLPRGATLTSAATSHTSIAPARPPWQPPPPPPNTLWRQWQWW
jgi:hypothetical protein